MEGITPPFRLSLPLDYPKLYVLSSAFLTVFYSLHYPSHFLSYFCYPEVSAILFSFSRFISTSHTRFVTNIQSVSLLMKV